MGLTAAVSVAGYGITNSQEKKNQGRLALDTTVNGLQLIINQEGTDYAPKAVVAGALATLISLHQPAIALRALSAAWRDKAIDTASAVWLISEVMLTNDDKIQLEAARLLHEQAGILCDDSPGEFSWPPALFERWSLSMPIDARVFIIAALLKVLVSKPLSWWDESIGNGTVWAISTLDEVMLKDSSPYVKSVAGDALDVLLEGDHELYVLSFVSGEKKIEDIRRRLKAIDRNWESPYTQNLLQQLRVWISGTGTPAANC